MCSFYGNRKRKRPLKKMSASYNFKTKRCLYPRIEFKSKITCTDKKDVCGSHHTFHFFHLFMCCRPLINMSCAPKSHPKDSLQERRPNIGLKRADAARTGVLFANKESMLLVLWKPHVHQVSHTSHK